MVAKEGKQKFDENNQTLISTSVHRNKKQVKQTVRWVFQPNTKLQKCLRIIGCSLNSQRDTIVKTS